jgi:hypothetical protein
MNRSPSNVITITNKMPTKYFGGVLSLSDSFGIGDRKKKSKPSSE